MGGLLCRNIANKSNGLGKENEKENEKAEQFERTRRINGGTKRRKKKERKVKARGASATQDGGRRR